MDRAVFRPFSIAFALYIASTVGGCGLFGPPFPPGTYNADIPCTLTAGEGDTAATDSFVSSTSLEVGDDGSLLLNGERVAVGQQITFSIPTADLAFEIVAVRRGLASVWVTFEPRPTLPGISIDGSMEQMFWNGSGDIHASADAILDVTDISRTTRLTVSCAGTLTRP